MPREYLRIGRHSIPGQVYHVVACTADRIPYFRDYACARLLTRCLIHENTTHVDTLAFCLMPDHLHWLFQLRENLLLEEILQAVKSVSAHHINRHLGRRGKIWDPGYYDHAMRKECPSSTIHYILRNPIQAGIVRDIRQYPHWDAKDIPDWV